jgi:hypothetical protein
VQAEWETKWPCTDSQEVGLEAAILERVRNSSLVQRGCADNVTGLSLPPKPWKRCLAHRLVGERCVREEASGQPGVEGTQVRMLA